MKYTFFVIVFLFLAIPFYGWSQPNDFITLRKKDHVVKSYFAGDHITFLTTKGAFRDAQITRIVNDSIYLQEYLVNRIPTTYGGYILDTAGSFRYAYNYREIHSFGPKQKKGFDIGRSGIGLFGGGSVLTLASLAVLAINKDKFSPLLFSAGLGGVVLGYVLGKVASKSVTIGKNHYNIQYTNLQK